MSVIFIGCKGSKSNVSGQSTCFNYLISDYRITPSCIIDLYSKSPNRLFQIILYFFKFTKYIYALIVNKSNSVYLQISQGSYGFYRDLVFINLGKIFKKQIIIHLHGGGFDHFYMKSSSIQQFLIRCTYSKVDKAIVLSEYYKKIFQNVGIEDSKIAVVYNGVEVPEKYRIIDKKFNKEYNLIYLSNLIESKGYFDVLEFFQLLIKDGNSNYTLHFCGEFKDSADDKRFKNSREARYCFFDFIKKNNLQDKVFFHGIVDYEKKWRILSESHFFLLPTKYCNEGQPMSLIEAMQMGVIPLVTDFRAIKYMVKDGFNGHFVPYGNPKSLFACFKNIDLNSLSEISKNAIISAREKYDLNVHKNAIIDLLNIPINSDAMSK